jgi:hypothetical protein
LLHVFWVQDFGIHERWRDAFRLRRGAGGRDSVRAEGKGQRLHRFGAFVGGDDRMDWQVVSTPMLGAVRTFPFPMRAQVAPPRVGSRFQKPRICPAAMAGSGASVEMGRLCAGG